MRKIGFVIPWYGENVPGGTEMKLREIAVHLQKTGMETEILTTCIRESTADWNQNYFSAGTAVVDDVVVRRFPVQKRDAAAYERINRRLMQGYRLSQQEEQTFTEEMIHSPQLYDYLQSASEEYGLYVFLPYQYGTTYAGIQLFPEKSVLIPCFREEPLLHLRSFRQTYVQARGMIYSSKPEQELAGHIYDFTATAQTCIGIGMNTKITANGLRFREKYGIQKPFLLYAGRKDAEKNLPLLLQYFAEYKKRNPDSLQLMLIGSGSAAAIPESVQKDVHDLGFLPEQDKYDAMAAAQLLCLPSRSETFSVAMMESWLCGRPVLVHAGCAVTRHFVRRAEAGLYFGDYFEFEGCVQYLISHPQQAETMGQNGGRFVQDQFDWSVIAQKYRDFFEMLMEA